jgi:transposase
MDCEFAFDSDQVQPTTLYVEKKWRHGASDDGTAPATVAVVIAILSLWLTVHLWRFWNRIKRHRSERESRRAGRGRDVSTKAFSSAIVTCERKPDILALLLI